ncbi:MAG: NAD-dependent epimerase/dehydratase family protein [Clostridiaceae bacterium]|nr:NAD-dependent epimerase/dehydratase family protein [Clostridiaceae bacterium]
MDPIIKEDARIIADFDLPWDRLKGKTVLISGSNGYVPSYFVHAFLMRNDLYNAGIKVIALCRNKERANNRFKDYLDRDDFSLVIQDVCDPIDIAGDIHFLIHAASPSGARERHNNPVITFNANVLGAINMLELSREKNAEGFLLVSSVDVYGMTGSADRLTETDVGTIDGLNIRNAYSCGKRAAETISACYCAQYGIPVVIVRPTQIMGPGIDLNDGRLHIDFISQILKNRKIVLKSDGQAKRSFMYITDAITGMLTAMLKGIPGEAYNVASEEGEATVLELASLALSLIGGNESDVIFDYKQRNSPEVLQALPNVTASSRKLQSLGWKANFTLKEGMLRLMQFYGVFGNTTTMA